MHSTFRRISNSSLAHTSILGLIFVKCCHCHFLLSFVLNFDDISIDKIVVDVLFTRGLKCLSLLSGLVWHFMRKKATIGLIICTCRWSCLNHLDYLLSLMNLLFLTGAEGCSIIIIFSLWNLFVFRRNTRNGWFLKQLMPFLLLSDSLLHIHLGPLNCFFSFEICLYNQFYKL